MTREEKNLLLKDLCARLPYGVICKGYSNKFNIEKDVYVLVEVQDKLSQICAYDVEDPELFLGLFDECKLEDVKPYLRPMSSLTEDDKKRWEDFCFIDTGEIYDFLNSNHFDYRNLIEKGLALEAPEGMYKEE